ncbi:MAG TPA: PAS domain-containing sensor histidine kinase, partial [Clostridium sp.]
MEIKSQKELLETVIETMYDPIIVYDERGSIILMNAESRKLYPHYNTHSKVSTVHNGYQCFDLDNNVIPVENLPTRRVFKGERIRNERIIIKHLEWTRYTEINATPIFDDENNLVSAVLSQHDISESVKNQEKIKQQQERILKAEEEKNADLEKALVMKDEFYINISHELKTPLNVIYSTVQLFSMYCSNDSL